MLDINDPKQVIEVERLQLAAWLRLNGQVLVNRRLELSGDVTYVFRRSSDTDDLVKRWKEKTIHEFTLSRYSTLVAREVRQAHRLRRNAGLTEPDAAVVAPF